MSIKLGSLFDGSGGFPLAGAISGIEPVWAAEHPAPVYPSLDETWKSLFPNSSVTPCPKWVFGEDYYPIFACAEYDCDYCKKVIPMHPGVAEKLGIKPKEG